jgi:hypothetical protein
VTISRLPCAFAINTKEIMTDDVNKLKEEINNLRSVVLSMSATLMTHAALQTVSDHSAANLHSRDLIGLAEECFRCARLPELKSPIAEGLEAIGHELMARAVALDTKRDRAER